MKIRYDVLDSLSDISQKVYLFLVLHKNKIQNHEALAAILHITEKELSESLLEIIAKTK